MAFTSESEWRVLKHRLTSAMMGVVMRKEYRPTQKLEINQPKDKKGTSEASYSLRSKKKAQRANSRWIPRKKKRRRTDRESRGEELNKSW